MTKSASNPSTIRHSSHQGKALFALQKPLGKGGHGPLPFAPPPLPPGVDVSPGCGVPLPATGVGVAVPPGCGVGVLIIGGVVGTGVGVGLLLMGVGVAPP